MLTTAMRTHQRPSADAPVPDDVVDVMLWRLAFDVAVEHQRDSTGNCTNLRCAGQFGACEPMRHAQHALAAARRPPALRTGTTPPVAAPPAAVHRPAALAVGRAVVARSNSRFTGWFTHTAAATVNRWRDHRLPKRTPGAAIAVA
ncbi:hypothetical protein ACFPIJ_56550 [Dactylosporangium cerinum]|uniref:Uncharacterized protein n=1 Tax=Dactylosporangium cerinum TaxID=1434730 RepID=A0ABV9WG16_9ACTN